MPRTLMVERLNVEPDVIEAQLAHGKSGPLGMDYDSVLNQACAKTFPIPTYVDQGKRWADLRDVAAHFDACRA